MNDADLLNFWETDNAPGQSESQFEWMHLSEHQPIIDNQMDVGMWRQLHVCCAANRYTTVPTYECRYSWKIDTVT